MHPAIVRRIPLMLIGLIVCASVHYHLSYAAGSSVPPVSAINLTLADLPKGFTQASNISLDDAGAAAAQRAEGNSDTTAAEVRTGRLRSNERSFGRMVNSGLNTVDATVIAYTSPATARAAYLQARKVSPVGCSCVVTGITSLSMGPLGVQHFSYAQTLQSGSSKMVSITMEFYRGRYDVLVLLGWVGGTSYAQQAQHVVGVIDRRISTIG